MWNLTWLNKHSIESFISRNDGEQIDPERVGCELGVLMKLIEQTQKSLATLPLLTPHPLLSLLDVLGVFALELPDMVLEDD